MRRRPAFVLLGVLCCGASRFGEPLRSPCALAGTYTIQVHVLAPREIAELARQLGSRRRGHEKTVAFLADTQAGQPALIVPPLRGQNDRERMEAWGHELAHVVCGQFHTVT